MTHWRLYGAFIAVMASGCGDLLATDPLITETAPVWITASWVGGASDPTDRTDREPSDFEGQLCPASSLILQNHTDEFAGLHIVNNCTIPVSFAICQTAGGLAQPEFGLQECATDPFETPFNRLKFITLNPGNLGDFINATEILSVQVFYCDDTAFLAGEPIRCQHL